MELSKVADAKTAGIALISVDLDDSWSYLRTHGDSSWRTADSVIDVATARLLALFNELRIRVTVFVVGRDAQSPPGREAIGAFHDKKHEIANHSLDHRFDLARLTAAEISDNIARSAELISSVTGVVPVGFRCPSFGVGAGLHKALAGQAYAYDASLLPTSIGPILRWYHRRTMTSDGHQSTRSQEIFGPVSDARFPLTPFRWKGEGAGLLELPVSTFPILRTPMHMSYIHALGALSTHLAAGYLKAGLRLCRRFKVSPSFLIHPPDVLNHRDAPDLAYLPGMHRPWQVKVEELGKALISVMAGRASLTHIQFANQFGSRIYRVHDIDHSKAREQLMR